MDINTNHLDINKEGNKVTLRYLILVIPQGNIYSRTSRMPNYFALNAEI